MQATNKLFTVSDQGSKTSEFFRFFAPETTRLLLDGTGPGISYHFPNLAQLGREKLLKFSEVHAFSGGIYAYIVYTALNDNGLRHDLEEYAENIDRRFLSSHFENGQNPLGTFLKILLKKPAFRTASITAHARYIFKKNFLQQPVSSLPRNFIPYLNVEGRCTGIDTQNSSFKDKTIEELLTAGSAIPFLYIPDALTEKYSDAVYASDYRRVRRAIVSADAPLVLSCMWQRKSEPSILQLEPPIPVDAKKRIRGEMFSILFRRPMPHWRNEIRTAFMSVV